MPELVRRIRAIQQKLKTTCQLLSLDAPSDLVRYTFPAPPAPPLPSMGGVESMGRTGQQLPGGEDSQGLGGGDVSGALSESEIRHILSRRVEFAPSIVQSIKIRFLPGK